MIFKLHQDIEFTTDLEMKIGEYLEKEMEKSGFEITLPSHTDWGYVFRIKFAKYLFDILIQLSTPTEISVAIDSVKSPFGKIFPKKDTQAKNELKSTIEILIANYWRQ